MVPFDRSRMTSYSTYKATICLSHSISEIQLDEKQGVDKINKNWLPWQRSLSDCNPISPQSSTLKVYQSWKFRDSRSNYMPISCRFGYSVMKNKVWIQSTENWLPSQRSLRYQKDNFRSFIYGQSSTIRANFIEIGQVDVEIIGLKEITKNI